MKSSRRSFAIFFLYILAVAAIVAIGYFLIQSEVFKELYYISSFGLFSLVVAYIFNNYYEQSQSKISWAEEKVNQTKQAIVEVKHIGELAVNEFPFGIIIYEKDGSIAWMNSFMIPFFSNDEDEHHLNELEPQLKSNLIDLGMKSQTIQTEVVTIQKSKDEDGKQTEKEVLKEWTLSCAHDPEFNVIYFTDMTDVTVERDKFVRTRLAVGYINLDNLSENLSSRDVQDRVTLQTAYFSLMGKWAKANNVFLKAISDEQFMFLTDYENLERIVKEDFDLSNDEITEEQENDPDFGTILDRIRKAAPIKGVIVTGSIGVASGDEDALSLEKKAADALLQAQKRGGDQVVVLNPGQEVAYYGGKTESVEKRTRIKSKMISLQILSLIQSASNVIVLSHKRPDSDAYGAVIGAMKMAELANKDVDVFFDLEHADTSVKKMHAELVENRRELNEEAKNKPDAKQLVDLEKIFKPVVFYEGAKNKITDDGIIDHKETNIDKIINKDTVVIVVDVNNPRIIEGAVANLTSAGNVIVIDHHRRTNEMVHNTLAYIEPYASSTVELVVELLQYQDDMELSSMEATIMLTGLYVDTVNFSIRTGARTFDAASYLRSQGADMTNVKKNLREDIDEITKRARFLADGEVYENRFGILRVTEEVTSVQLAKLADSLLMSNDLDAAFAIGLSKGGTGISARSFGDVNVQVLMEQVIHGGGHINAAAGYSTDLSVNEVYDILTDALDEIEVD